MLIKRNKSFSKADYVGLSKEGIEFLKGQRRILTENLRKKRSSLNKINDKSYKKALQELYLEGSKLNAETFKNAAKTM